jgi:acetyltransferase-like isoleucine patch superfamily enzyme
VGETIVAADVILGHPSKDSLLKHRSFEALGEVTIGSGCILRSGTVVYETVRLGNDVQTGHHVVIREGVTIGDGSVVGGFSVVREHAHLGRNVRLMESVSISEGAELGNDIFIGPHVCFTAGRQMTGALEAAGRMTYADAAASEGKYWEGASVIVEDDVRIGANSVILAGVRLGKGCVVAAGAVVSYDVPAGAVAAGNPARLLKRPVPEG